MHPTPGAGRGPCRDATRLVHNARSWYAASVSHRPITDVWILARPRLRNGAKCYGAYPLGLLHPAHTQLGVQLGDPVLHVGHGMVRRYP